MRNREKNRWGKEIIRALFGLGMMWLVCFQKHALAFDPVSEAERQTEVQAVEDDVIFYTALGDSIANGYYEEQEAEVVGYPVLIAGDLEEISGNRVELASFARNGLTSKKLNKEILSDPLTIEEIARADLITLTIGANDLLKEFKKVSREILDNKTRFYTADEAVSALQEGIMENPLLLIDVVSAVSSWDYDSFEKQWLTVMECICAHRKEGSQLVVTTIYNPIANRELPGTLNAVIESVISKMNEIMQEHAEEYAYQVADLLGSGIEKYVQSDGLHPNQVGQNMIREFIEYRLDLDAFRSEGADYEVQRALEEAAAREAEAAEQRKQKEQRKMRMMTMECAAGIFFAVVGIMVVLKKRTANRKMKEIEK